MNDKTDKVWIKKGGQIWNTNQGILSKKTYKPIVQTDLWFPAKQGIHFVHYRSKATR